MTAPRWGRLLLLAAIGLSVAHAFHFNHVADDAYISFRYADNLVHGRGLVFNPGERVMGYSNLLWVLLVAGLEAVGISAPLAGRLLGVVFASASLWLVDRELVRHGAGLAARAGALGLLAANGTFALWMFGGLEGPLFAWLLLLGSIRTSRLAAGAGAGAGLVAGLPFAAAVLTRPEAPGYAVAAAVALLLRRRRPAALAGFALPVVVAAAGLAAWSLAYYGDALPNTYYAKQQPLTLLLAYRGLAYTGLFLKAYNGVPALAVAVWLVTRRRGPSAAGFDQALLVAAFVAFFVAVGGDGLVYHRMWLWTLPLLALLAGLGLADLEPRRPRLAAALAVGGVALSLPHSLVGPGLAYLRQDDALVRRIGVISRRVGALEPPPLVAANMVGLLSYAGDVRIVDMLGLTDRHVARAPGKLLAVPGHESHDGAYVLSRRPDLVFVWMPRVLPRPVTRDEAVATLYASDIDLLQQPGFDDAYRLANLRLSGDRFAPVFVRRDYADAVAAAAEASGRPPPFVAP